MGWSACAARPRGVGRGEGQEHVGGPRWVLKDGRVPETGQELDLRTRDRTVVMGRRREPPAVLVSEHHVQWCVEDAQPVRNRLLFHVGTGLLHRRDERVVGHTAYIVHELLGNLLVLSAEPGLGEPTDLFVGRWP